MDGQAAHVEKAPADTENFPCAQCGAMLRYRPGTSVLHCDYCGHDNPIEPDEAAIIVEHDFRAALADGLNVEETELGDTFKCDGCGAEVEKDPRLTAMDCPFCGHAMVVDAGSTRKIRPESLVPFQVDRAAARERFRGWIRRLWFAPRALKQMGHRHERLEGVYLPYWTYDTRATTDYTGQRGEHYWETEHYTTTDANGKTVRRSRQVRRTRWYAASGTVRNAFDDLLVNASSTLPADLRAKLEGWDLAALMTFEEAYLSGFRAEVYQLRLEEGFDVARQLTVPAIRSTIRSDIGGDEQRISSMNCRYHDTTFKHLLLPVWLSSYRYRNKVYRFVINGQSGQVFGQRPYSYWKIFLLVAGVVAGLAVAAGLFALAQGAH